MTEEVLEENGYSTEGRWDHKNTFHGMATTSLLAPLLPPRRQGRSTRREKFNTASLGLGTGRTRMPSEVDASHTRPTMRYHCGQNLRQRASRPGHAAKWAGLASPITSSSFRGHRLAVICSASRRRLERLPSHSIFWMDFSVKASVVEAAFVEATAAPLGCHGICDGFAGSHRARGLRNHKSWDLFKATDPLLVRS